MYKKNNLLQKVPFLMILSNYNNKIQIKTTNLSLKLLKKRNVSMVLEHFMLMN